MTPQKFALCHVSFRLAPTRMSTIHDLSENFFRRIRKANTHWRLKNPAGTSRKVSWNELNKKAEGGGWIHRPAKNQYCTRAAFSNTYTYIHSSLIRRILRENLVAFAAVICRIESALMRSALSQPAAAFPSKFCRCTYAGGKPFASLPRRWFFLFIIPSCVAIQG